MRPRVGVRRKTKALCHAACTRIKTNSRLYNALNQWMSQPVAWSHLCHLKTCIWMIVALIHTGSVNLTKWSMSIPCRGQFAQSRQRRIQRWLNNPRINVHRIYGSLIKTALSDRSESKIFLALDTSLFWDEYCLVRLSVIHRGEAICLHNVQIHKGEFYGRVHVIMGRNSVNGELWAIVSDEKTTIQTFAEYGLRFDIEENFLDDQSGGWNVQRSMIRDVGALSRLWFILAIATLYVSAQGVEVVRAGKRRWVDPHWFRGNSYFRIGWDWVQAALLNGWKLLHCVTFSSNQDPDPAMASRSQHERRIYQLEFKVLTYSYDVS